MRKIIKYVVIPLIIIILILGSLLYFKYNKKDKDNDNEIIKTLSGTKIKDNIYGYKLKEDIESSIVFSILYKDYIYYGLSNKENISFYRYNIYNNENKLIKESFGYMGCNISNDKLYCFDNSKTDMLDLNLNIIKSNIGSNIVPIKDTYYVIKENDLYDNENIMVKAVTEESDYKIKNRMIHICVFPENDLYFIKKLIRLSALCQYTHIVIEFWGMLQYDCLKELAWPHAFTKDDVRELIRECRELGIEPVPMCNQLGHASASRACYGKHVVLDQNPSLQRLFTPDGWAWNIESDEAKMLLRRIREELYDLFGEGDYMHIGCDEAYFISKNARLRQLFPQYLVELTREVEREGRRPMLWMDMLLDKSVSALDCSVEDQKEVEGIRNSLAPSSVFVDWQYDCTEAPIPSLVSLKDCGRDVIGAPWFNRTNYRAHIDTLADNDMYGLMLTTGHTLQTWMQTIVDCAKAYGAATFVWRDSSDMYIETATMLRRISFEGNSYANCGWSKEQINV